MSYCASSHESSQLALSTFKQSWPSILEPLDLPNRIFKICEIELKKAPIMICFYRHSPIPVILDTGAEYNVIGDITARRLNLPIKSTNCKAQQVDQTPLRSIGKISVPISNGEDTWNFDALVCTGIGDTVIAGNPLLKKGITPIASKNLTQIESSNGSTRSIPWRPQNITPKEAIISIIRSSDTITIFPDEYCELECPKEFKKFESSEVIILPRLNIFFM